MYSVTVERQADGSFRQVGRFLVNLNLFQTDTTDQARIYDQRWSTRVYLFLLLSSMCILLVQNALRIEDRLIEVRNPSIESFLELQKRYSDVSCPCSRISAPYGSFVTLIPVYHPICSSEFISQTWIDMLFDNMTVYRFAGDFRTTASTQFQVLRTLCQFSQNTLSDSVRSFSESEFISGTLLSERRWRIETEAVINAFLDSTFTNARHRMAFLRSFVTFSLLVSGIQTPIALVIVKHNELLVATTAPIFYQRSEDDDYCACDDGGVCYFSSKLYNAGVTDNYVFITYWVFQVNASLTLKNWFTGCWALESVLRSSTTDNFFSNQTVLDQLATYFDWGSDSGIPTALTLGESSEKDGSNGTFDGLLQTLFVEKTMTELKYSIYFDQCYAQSCFYSDREHQSILYSVTSLLALYGGLSFVLRFLTPYLVVFVMKRFRRHATASSAISKLHNESTFLFLKSEHSIQSYGGRLARLELFSFNTCQQSFRSAT